MFKDYLLLIRAPNLFTIPSNILAGYFAVVPISIAETGQLLSLIFSSVLLYASGIVLNDYVDIGIDRNERPNRPLVSGRITKRNALIFVVVSIIAGNILAFAVSWASMMISALLTSVIVAYNFRLKRNAVANPLSMGLARFLNIVLGGSPALGLLLVPYQDYTLLIFIGYCLFLHTAAISILSRKEIDVTRLFSGLSWITIILSFSLVLIAICSILVASLWGVFQSWFVFNLIIYSVVMIFSLLRLMTRLRNLTKKIKDITQNEEYHMPLNEESIKDGECLEAAREIQSTVKIMILSIVVLDSVFVSGIVGIIAGMATLILIIPPILLGRRLYVT